MKPQSHKASLSATSGLGLGGKALPPTAWMAMCHSQSWLLSQERWLPSSQLWVKLLMCRTHWSLSTATPELYGPEMFAAREIYTGDAEMSTYWNSRLMYEFCCFVSMKYPRALGDGLLPTSLPCLCYARKQRNHVTFLPCSWKRVLWDCRSSAPPTSPLFSEIESHYAV